MLFFDSITVGEPMLNKNRLKKILILNWVIIIYLIIAILIELTGVYVTSSKFYIRQPSIILSLLFLFALILYFVRNQVARVLVATVLLGFQGILNISFVMLYDLTGQIFDYTMIDLRQDAWGMLESVPLNFTMCFTFGLLYSAFITFGYRFASLKQDVEKIKKPILKGFILVLLSMTCLYFSVSGSLVRQNFYEELLYSTDNRNYSDLGIMGNTTQTLIAGATKEEIELGDKKEIENFIFDQNNIHYSNFPYNYEKDYNVVTILCESLEWMAIVEDLDKFPYGLKLENKVDSSKTAAQLLFPNLYNLMKESQVFTNFHSKEKTDISENYTHFGSYPTGALTNYDFAKNKYPMAIANTLKVLDNDIKTTIVHDGYENFYNRKAFEPVLGYDTYYGAESLEGDNFKIWSDERNLDSQMVLACQDELFPQNQRFYSYIITVTQHGQYIHRKSLEEAGYYDRLKEFGFVETGDELNDAFLTYVAAALELDKMVGIINDILVERNLKDNTILTLFADHNCYYSGLSNRIKDIYSFEQAKGNNKNYLDLYRVPLIMYIPNMGHKLIDKFVTTYDILPTILDVLGINYYGNVYYGHSAFDSTESVMYSRAYSFFATSDLYFTSLNRIKFAYKDAKMTELIENKTKELVKKIEYTDRIFYNDFYSLRNDYGQTYNDFYQNKILNLNLKARR